MTDGTYAIPIGIYNGIYIYYLTSRTSKSMKIYKIKCIYPPYVPNTLLLSCILLLIFHPDHDSLWGWRIMLAHHWRSFTCRRYYILLSFITKHNPPHTREHSPLGYTHHRHSKNPWYRLKRWCIRIDLRCIPWGTPHSIHIPA
jgi:hypothetical protein